MSGGEEGRGDLCPCFKVSIPEVHSSPFSVLFLQSSRHNVGGPRCTGAQIINCASGGHSRRELPGPTDPTGSLT